MAQASIHTTASSVPMVRHLEVLRTIAEAVSSLDPSAVIDTSLDALTHVTGHEISSLHLLAPEGGQLVLRGDRGLSEQLREVNRVLPMGHGMIGRVAQSGLPRRVADVTRAKDLLPAARAAVVTDGIRAFVCVPVRARRSILGTLSLGRQKARPFTDDEVALLQCAADQIGLSLELARLHSETQSQLARLERAQTAVVRAERLSAVGELTRGVAHEINTPLTIILGQVEVMLQEGLDGEVREALGVIDRAARRVAGVVRDMRQFVDPPPAERTCCQLDDLVERALAREAPYLLADCISWRLDADAVPSVWADVAQLGQLLHLLIDNARHAMRRAHGGGALAVRLALIDSAIRLEVADDGPGIAPEILPRIFTPFFTTKSAEEGRGLGLSVAHGIVQQHGGRLWAENRREGGARFVIELPRDLRRTGGFPAR